MKKLLLFLLPVFLFYSLGYSQFTTTSPGGVSNSFTRGTVKVGSTTPTFISPLGYFQAGRLGYYGTYNSTQVQGIWSISNAYPINTTSNNFGTQYGLGYAYSTTGGAPFVNTHQILFTNNGVIGASIGLDGKAYFKGNFGIGTTNPQNKLEITHGVNGNSGLRFTNLNASSTFTPNTINRSLTLNTLGDVIFGNSVNTVSHSLVGNSLTTTINGVSSNTITLPSSSSSSNIYNNDGTLNQDRTVYFNDYKLSFINGFNLGSGSVEIDDLGSKSGATSLLKLQKDYGNYQKPNLDGIGVFTTNVYDRYSISPTFTHGLSSSASWMQSSKVTNNSMSEKFPLLINPLGGNVGIGVNSPTAQLHTIKSVRFEDLPFEDIQKINGILGTDDLGNVWNIDPSQLGTGTSQDAWLLNGNTATNPGTGVGQNFIGTNDAKDLVFGVNSDEKLRITQTGRLKFFNSSSSPTWEKNIYIGGGNDNVSSLPSNINYANVAVGLASLSSNTTGYANTATGFNTLRSNTTGTLNSAIGINSLFNNTIGFANVSMGHNSMYENINGSNNTAIGNLSLVNNKYGSNNIAIGSLAGHDLIQGNNNIFIGGGPTNSNVSNELNIGNKIYGLGVGPNNSNIGIGVPVPTARFHTKGDLRFENLSEVPEPNTTFNQVLVTDNIGNVRWRDANTIGNTTITAWNLIGNGSTNPTNNFVGTTDNNALAFRTNNLERLRIDINGRYIASNTTFGTVQNSNLFFGGVSNAQVPNQIGTSPNSFNTTFGLGSLNNNTNGEFNDSFGIYSLMNNTTGSGNSAFGGGSLRNNTSGRFNAAFGISTLRDNTTGEGNSGFGTWALFSNTTGRRNTATGHQAGVVNNTGEFNVFNGAFAGRNITSGSNNTLLGFNCGVGLTTGNNNIFVGANTNPLPDGNNQSNRLNIGNWIYGRNGTIGIGTTAFSENGIGDLGTVTGADPFPNTYRLFVEDGIRTRKIRVDLRNWADYVFKKEYQLMSLNELEKFISTNGHLPNIPSADVVAKEGIDLGEMNNKLLEKIEELTLHTIELNKKNEALELEKVKQAKLIEDLAKRLEKLEAKQ